MSAMSFELDRAIQAANEAVTTIAGRPLSDVETIILKGAWQRLDYDQIAAQNQYATTYVSNDIAPKLWKLLTDALGVKVRKSNFKAALERYWEHQLSEQLPSPLESHSMPVDNELTHQKPTIRLERSQELSSEVSCFDRFEVSEEDPGLVSDQHYIDRYPVEKICYEALLKPGSLLRIKAPQRMGKTSLVNQLAYLMSRHDYRTANLSFEMADRCKHFSDLNQFLRWFCLNVSRELGLPGNLEEYWDEAGMGAKVSCTTYFEEYLLPQAQTPLLLCLDDVDLLFAHPAIYEDFFGLLRSWYEKARSRRVWQKLRLVIAHATDVYIRLNLHQSPFNVGVPVSLPDFTQEQARQFAQRFQLTDEADVAIETLFEWVGGHPYLLKLAFGELADRSMDYMPTLLAEIASDSGIYSSHLRRHLLSMQQDPALAKALVQVVCAEAPVKLETITAYKLQSMGLITLTGNMAQCRCQLYRHYFAERLEDLTKES
jgi:hypothetical protein